MKKKSLLILFLALLVYSCGPVSERKSSYDEDTEEEEVEEVGPGEEERAQRTAKKIENRIEDLTEELDGIETEIKDWLQSMEDDSHDGKIPEPEKVSKKVKSFSKDLDGAQKKLDKIKGMITDADEELDTSDYSAQLDNLENRINGYGEFLEKFENKYSTNYEIPKQEKQEEQRRLEEKSERVAQAAVEGKTCYYIVATKNQLKEYKLTDKSFLKLSNLNSSFPQLQYFNKAGINTLRSIELNSKKVKILTEQGKGQAYLISQNPDGTKKLEILDPDEFWKDQNFLVVQID